MNKYSRSLQLPLLVDGALLASVLIVAVLAVSAVFSSALPWPAALIVAALVLALAWRELATLRAGRWQQLVLDPDLGHSLVDAEGTVSACRLASHGRAGPWLVLRMKDAEGRVHAIFLRERLLGEQRWRRLRRLLKLNTEDELVGQEA